MKHPSAVLQTSALSLLAVLSAIGCSDGSTPNNPYVTPLENQFAFVWSDNCVYGFCSMVAPYDSVEACALDSAVANGGKNPTVMEYGVIHGFGAVAISDDGSGCEYGIVWNYPSSSAARLGALELCEQYGGVNPIIVEEFYGN